MRRQMLGQMLGPKLGQKLGQKLGPKWGLGLAFFGVRFWRLTQASHREVRGPARPSCSQSAGCRGNPHFKACQALAKPWPGFHGHLGPNVDVGRVRHLGLAQRRGGQAAPNQERSVPCQ